MRARGAPPVDARQVDAAAALLRERDERRGVELLGEGGVEGDAPVGAQLRGRASTLRATSCAACGALVRRHAATAGIERRPQRSAGGTRTRIRKRHPHVPVRTVALEPEQQVGRAAAGKAFRSKADLHSAARKPRVPRVFQLGSEVTRPAYRTPQATHGTLYTKTAGSAQAERRGAAASQLELLALAERALDALAQRAHPAGRRRCRRSTRGPCP